MDLKGLEVGSQGFEVLAQPFEVGSQGFEVLIQPFEVGLQPIKIYIKDNLYKNISE